MKKKIVIPFIISLLFIILIPISMACFGFICPMQFDETYYGELPYMFKRLKDGKSGKIILVGNSALAFGVRSDIISEKLNKEVVLFGLYGAIGTKAMIDLSKAGIKKGDIVILAPEITEQGLSLFFSSENMWMAIDGHYDMLPYIGKDNKESMTGNFNKFVSSKAKYFFRGKKPEVEGVYMQSSFNLDGKEVGYLTYEREYNIMINGFDNNATIDYQSSYLKDDFVKYINEYADYVKKKGASIYYGFAPTNRLAVSSLDKIKDFYSYLKDSISFQIMGNPQNYLFDYEWFYDNNFHLNSAGAYIYNKQLIDDLKIILEDPTPTEIEIPSKPLIPVPEFEDGDNSDVDCFTYEPFNDGYLINSLTELGRSKKSIIVPSTYNNRPVISFGKETFKDNKTIGEIVIQKNVRTLPDNGLNGCSSLTKVILRHDSPSKINVGTSFLNGADNASVYVKKDSYETFINHYNWAYYRDRIKTY